MVQSGTTRAGSRHDAENTRAAILDAAMREFAMEGIAGARTESIARSAGVNKALLYYYFRDKEALFGAVMDRAFAELAGIIARVVDSDLPPREKFLRYVEAHFDFVASSPMRPRLFHREMMRSGPNGSPLLKQLVEQHLRPTFSKLAQLIARGIDSGDFRPVDPAHFIPSVVGTIVFYFSTPIPAMISGRDTFAADNVAQRRAAVIDFVSAALFRDHAGANGATDVAGKHPSGKKSKGARK